ncbi:uncharacterized protein [Ptychodera flava]|uniref:uncharacterized protein isoform X1 n=1 Tax=Ptychodera flava TaxID=63121 RepID=UPI00396A0A3F
MATADAVSICVRYVDGGLGYVPIQCCQNDRVSDLATQLQKNAHYFGLSSEDIDLNSLEIYQLSADEQKKPLHFRTPLREIGKAVVEFDNNSSKGSKFQAWIVNKIWKFVITMVRLWQVIASIISGNIYVLVCHAGSYGNAVPLRCRTSDTVYDIATQIKKQSHLFNISADQVSLNDVKLWECDDDWNCRRRLEFNSLVVEKDLCMIMFETYQVLRLSFKDIASTFEVSIVCRDCHTVHDVINIVQQHIAESKSHNPVSNISLGDEILLLQSSDSVPNRFSLLPSTNPMKEFKDSDLYFFVKSNDMNLRPSKMYFSVTVRYTTERQTVQILLSEEDETFDMVEKIHLYLDKFKLSSDIINEVYTHGNEIVISEEGTTDILEYDQRIQALDNTKFTFSIITKAMKTISLDDVASQVNDQIIAFFGAPGHGKSTTINSIITSLAGIYQPIAQTWKGSSTGTAVVSTYPIKLKNKTFTCLDVPGNGLKKLSSGGDVNHAREVISLLLDGKFPKDQKLDYWSLLSMTSIWTYMTKPSTGRVDVVMIVAKCDAEFDELNTVVIEEAKRKERTVPVFLVLTHIDKIDRAQLQDKVEVTSKKSQINRSRIFTISNYGHSNHETIEDSRQNYILSALKTILHIAQ